MAMTEPQAISSSSCFILYLPQVEVDEVLGLVGDVGPEVAANNAMPSLGGFWRKEEDETVRMCAMEDPSKNRFPVSRIPKINSHSLFFWVRVRRYNKSKDHNALPSCHPVKMRTATSPSSPTPTTYRVVLLVELLLDEGGDVLLDVVLLQRLRRAIDCILLHVLEGKI